MGKVTKFVVEKLPPNALTMAPGQQKINLKDKVEDGEIDLSMCDLQDVPVRDIATIKKAYSLDLSNNHISLLPKNFATLTHLVKLDLSKNELKELPDNFGDLVKLKHLDLYRNQLQHLPLSFGKLQALKWLDLKDNMLVPAIASIAGPCLDSKQCQKCAKDIVNFYTQLQVKVEEERKVREAQRQKDLQLNAQKLKQEKKSKKDKKDKKRNKENGQTGDLAQSAKAEANEHESADSHLNGTNKACSNLTAAISLIRFLLVSMLLLISAGFVLTAAKIEFLQVIEDKTVEFWGKGIESLPADFQPFVIQVGESIGHLHGITGKGVYTVTNSLCELSKSESVHLIVTEMGNVFKNVTQTATEFYLKVFGK